MGTGDREVKKSSNMSGVHLCNWRCIYIIEAIRHRCGRRALFLKKKRVTVTLTPELINEVEKTKRNPKIVYLDVPPQPVKIKYCRSCAWDFVGLEGGNVKKTIYIFSDGELQRKDNTIYFSTTEGKKYLPVEDINELFVFGEVSLNKRFLEFVSQKEILIHYFNYYGYYMGTFYPREHYNSGYMILRQAEHYLDHEKRMAIDKQFVSGAVANIRRVLRYYQNRGKNLHGTLEAIDNLEQSLESCSNVSELMALEGNIRNYYYKAFDHILENPDFVFEERSRRPPKNYLNSLISFGNSILYACILSEIYRTHLIHEVVFSMPRILDDLA